MRENFPGFGCGVSGKVSGVQQQPFVGRIVKLHERVPEAKE
jgi:hypothetical protein